MCSTCGCGQSDDEVRILVPGEVEGLQEHIHHTHHHHHSDHSHTHTHDHDHGVGLQQIDLEKNILYQNDMMAQRNRGYLEAKNIYAVNLVSSPGSGKTTLLEQTVKQLKSSTKLTIIEGDQQSMNDAERIANTGAEVVQVNTGKGCHLDADMVSKAIKKLNPEENSLLFIENVGNLVCPSLFDLGENNRVVIISVTEGDDKPSKYPYMFESAQLCIINKIDLLPYVQFDLNQVKDSARRINPDLEFIELSATTNEGMELWLEWINSNKSN